MPSPKYQASRFGKEAERKILSLSGPTSSEYAQQVNSTLPTSIGSVCQWLQLTTMCQGWGCGWSIMEKGAAGPFLGFRLLRSFSLSFRMVAHEEDVYGREGGHGDGQPKDKKEGAERLVPA